MHPVWRHQGTAPQSERKWRFTELLLPSCRGVEEPIGFSGQWLSPAVIEGMDGGSVSLVLISRFRFQRVRLPHMLLVDARSGQGGSRHPGLQVDSEISSLRGCHRTFRRGSAVNAGREREASTKKKTKKTGWAPSEGQEGKLGLINARVP